jgi:hypothetical protein
MVDSFSDWLFNVLIWGAIVSLILLLAETAWRGVLASELDAIRAAISVVVIAVLALWPKY